jgi:hypothetical protein
VRNQPPCAGHDGDADRIRVAGRSVGRSVGKAALSTPGVLVIQNRRICRFGCLPGGFGRFEGAATEITRAAGIMRG